MTDQEIIAIHDAGIEKMIDEGGSWSIVDLGHAIAAAARAEAIEACLQTISAIEPNNIGQAAGLAKAIAAIRALLNTSGRE